MQDVESKIDYWSSRMQPQQSFEMCGSANDNIELAVSEDEDGTAGDGL